jgi:hypothetical protein
MNILYPVFLQVFLTFAVLVSMGPARAQSLRENRKSMNERDVALGQTAWNDAATKRANNFKNQFELPVLFYMAVALALILKQTDGILIGLAWVFALSRVVHAAVHIGPNIVMWRGAAYLVGMVALVALWSVLAIRVATGAA